MTDPTPTPPFTIDDFMKADLRVGRIVEATRHPNADRLLVLKVNLGEAEPRQIVFGGAQFFSPEDLIGQKVVVVANLPTAKLRGVDSTGMCLACKYDTSDYASDNGVIPAMRLVTVDAPPGTRIS